MSDFDTIITGLAAAVDQAKQTQEGYYQTLPSTLGEINRALGDITRQIEGIVNDLTQKNRLVEVNKAEINVLSGEKQAANQELNRLQAADRANQEKIALLDANTIQLEESRAKQASNFIAQQQELKNQLDETLKRERAADAANNETLKTELAEKEKIIRDELARLEILRKESEAGYRTKITELENQATAADQLAGELKAQISAKESESSDLSSRLATLEADNTTLKQQIERASALMEEATRLLRNLDPQNQTDIQNQIQLLQASISEINRILGSSEPREEQYQDARSFPPIDQTDEITLKNGIIITIKELIAMLLKKIGQMRKSGNNPEKFQTILDKIKNKTGQYGLETIQSDIANLDLTLRGDSFKGGRKTRRKHKKCCRKTKRKQRGGFHYSERAHRRRITTSSSSRRSSRRSSTRRTSRR